MRGSAIAMRIIALLGLLGWGGVVVLSTVTKGWFDGLLPLVVEAAIFAVYFVIGLLCGRQPRVLLPVIGMLLTVPLAIVPMAVDRYELRSLVIGGPPALLLGILSVVLLVTARRRRLAS